MFVHKVLLFSISLLAGEFTPHRQTRHQTFAWTYLPFTITMPNTLKNSDE